MNRRAILCVDDEAIILLSLVQELKNAFHDQFIYETTTNVKAAIEIAKGAQKTDCGILQPGLQGRLISD